MNEIWPWIEAAVGLLVVGTVLSDVFRSVVLPRATRRTLRLGPALGSLMLRAWLRWAGAKPTRRHAALGALGPLLIVMEMLIWVALLILGYAMLLQASGGLRPTPSFGDALYGAASSFVTTGLSGQEAATGLARLITAVAGFSGLAVVTLVVTFLLSVQGALLRREAAVLRLRARLGPGPSGVHLLETLYQLGPRRNEALPAFFEAWEAWAADVLLTHRAYPILCYFRSTDEDCGWLAALGAVLDAAALLAVMQNEDAGEHAVVCHRMGSRLIADLARQFMIRAPFAPGLDRAAFYAAIERLEAAGYRTDRARELMWPEFGQLRSHYLPPLTAMAQRLGEKAMAW